MAGEAAEKAVLDNKEGLTGALSVSAANFESILTSCESKGIVTTDDAATLRSRMTGQTLQVRATTLTDQIQSIVKFSPEKLDVFLKILKEKGGIPCRVMADRIAQALKSAKVTSTDYGSNPKRPDDAARVTTADPVLVHAEEDDHAEKVDGDGQLPDVQYYKVNERSRRRGIAVIINNIKFAVLEERSSSAKDAGDLETMFKNLRYKVIRLENLPGKPLKEDLRKKSIEEELKNIAKNEVTGEDDSFICCILSHGSADGIIGTDEKLVKIAELAKLFDAENCPNLSGKPKLFFLQACRGAGLSEPVTVDSASSGASNMPSPMEKMSVDGRTIPPEADFLFSFSTSDGTKAARSPDVNKGSPYIQELCQAITENAKRYVHVHSLVTLLTVVNFRVAGRNFKLGEKPFKVMPEYRSTLRKKVKLK